SENTDLTQLFAFSAETHLDIAKSPGIPGYPQCGINSCVKSSGFQFPIDRCVYDQTYTLSDKVISEDWQEKSTQSQRL
ncbi:hypothetical protein, partial [Bartonella sp. CL100XZDX]|uniref:hypothetical protein n=1 Tax=Bartonella sp. CL100XZDX TaxID=3243515 RepID=UPI0035D0DFDA